MCVREVARDDSAKERRRSWRAQACIDEFIAACEDCTKPVLCVCALQRALLQSCLLRPSTIHLIMCTLEANFGPCTPIPRDHPCPRLLHFKSTSHSTKSQMEFQCKDSMLRYANVLVRSTFTHGSGHDAVCMLNHWSPLHPRRLLLRNPHAAALSRLLHHRKDCRSSSTTAVRHDGLMYCSTALTAASNLPASIKIICPNGLTPAS